MKEAFSLWPLPGLARQLMGIVVLVLMAACGGDTGDDNVAKTQPIAGQRESTGDNAQLRGLLAPPPWGENGAILNTSVIFKTSGAGLMSDNHYTPLRYYNENIYFVWTDANNRPWLTKIAKDQSKENYPLDTGTDYTARPDGHNRFSLGIDKNGYVHVTGDMHNYTDSTTEQNGLAYPQRYQKQTILYWVSRKPENIRDGFAFAGGKGASTALPGTGWTYGRFFTDQKNELYYSSRVKAITGSHQAGELGFGIYRYDAAAKTWSALGKKADRIREGTYYDVVVWEVGGQAPDDWYQGLRGHVKFDADNRMHLALAINSNVAYDGDNRVIYAMSTDQGASWQKADGTRIPGLPIRAADGKANLGDIVADTTKAPWLFADVGVVADANGRPGVVTGNDANALWKVWNGKAWVTNTSHRGANAKVPNASYGQLSSNKALILTVNRAGKFLHSKSFDQLAYGYDLAAFQMFNAVDEAGLRGPGVVYGVGIPFDAKTESVLKTTVVPAPLPASWTSSDIAAAGSLGYAGLTGYADKRFVMTNYGVSIEGTTDSLHFAYTRMTGDGSIVARVTADAPGTGARAGVMMRDSLGEQSKFIAMTIAPRQGAHFAYRKSSAAASIGNTVAGIGSPYWVKLTRKGNIFTGSISADGTQWQEAGAIGFGMGTSLYVGLASASYNRGMMQTTTFDNVQPSLNLQEAPAQ